MQYQRQKLKKLLKNQQDKKDTCLLPYSQKTRQIGATIALMTIMTLLRIAKTQIVLRTSGAKMERFKLGRVAILAVLVALLIVFSGLAYNDYSLMQVIYYDSYGIVGPDIGFDTDDELIAFGMIRPGSSSSRKVEISNGPIPKEGFVYVRGSITPMIKIDKSPFSLEPYENKTIRFTMVAPFSYPSGYYTGEFKIVLKGKR